MRQASATLSYQATSRPLIAACAARAVCCLIVASSAAVVVNGFVVMPSLFRSSFLAGWTSPFGTCNRRKTVGNRCATYSSRCRTLGERRAWIGREDENSWNQQNHFGTNGGSNEAMKPFDDSVDENLELLKYRIARNRALGPGVQANEAAPKDVHIILFYPESEHEGVHTIEFPKGSGYNVILGFEDLEECVEFSRLLAQEEENLFVEPAPRQIHLQSLEAYCATTLGGDVQVQVVPKGTNLVPPSGTVEELNHNPMHLEEYERNASELERLFEMDVVPSRQRDEAIGAWE